MIDSWSLSWGEVVEGGAGGAGARRSAAGDGRDDFDDVGRADRGVQVVEVADVLVVHVDVDVLLELAAAVEDPLVELGVAGTEVAQDLAHGRALRLDAGLAVGVGSERGRNRD